MKPAKIDIPTLGLTFAVYTAQMLLLNKIEQTGWLLAMLLGIFIMNASFTIWHECAHGNFSNSLYWNNFFGRLASLLTLGNGYFATKAEHLIHHRHQGDPNKDPVVKRVQTSWNHFPANLLKQLFAERAETDWLKLTTAELAADRQERIATAAYLFFLIIVFGVKAVILVLIIPKVVVTFLHAFYICFLPHHKGKKDYQIFRIVTENPAACFLTWGQSLHGIHHRWPNIVWHQYRRHLNKYKETETVST